MKPGAVSMNTVDILAGMVERHTPSSKAQSVSVFITVSSHRYVAEKGSDVKIALLARMRNSL